jgi:hypothetical protein
LTPAQPGECTTVALASKGRSPDPRPVRLALARPWVESGVEESCAALERVLKAL